LVRWEDLYVKKRAMSNEQTGGQMICLPAEEIKEGKKLVGAKASPYPSPYPIKGLQTQNKNGVVHGE
jgi:hypothetical protein